MPVKVITSHAGSATRAVFQKKVMKKADYIANATIVKPADISRPLALITVGEPTPEVQKLIDFFRSPAG